MSSFIDQVDRIPFNALNGGTGDPVQGQPNTAVSGLPIIGYDGQLGKRVLASGVTSGTATAEALRLSNTTIGTLYGGIYQYVLFLSTSSASNALGQVVFWSDATKMIVTPDATAATISYRAGITLNAVAKGDYGWIQIAGIASVLFKTSITKTTPAAGDLVIVDQAPSDKADILADATNITSPILKSVLGIAYVDTPASTTVSRVLLQPLLAAAF